MLEFLLGACFFLCIFAPFTFVIFLIDAIKKVFAGLSLLVMLSGVVYLV